MAESSFFGLDRHGDKDIRRARGLLVGLKSSAFAVSESLSAEWREGSEVLGRAREAVLLVVAAVCCW